MGYKTNLQPDPVCEGCACLFGLSDCLVTASTWGDAACSTKLVERKIGKPKEYVPISTFASTSGYIKVDGATTSCSVDTTVKGGPAYAADTKYVCNYFGPCTDIWCAAASQAQCLLLAGNVECPSSFPQKEVAFTSVNDKRTCTCDCAGAPSSCAVAPGRQVADLITPAETYPLTAECRAHANTGGTPPNNAGLYSRGILTPLCVPAGKPVTGTIEVQDYKTVCCR